jgi:hypothetical protein
VPLNGSGGVTQPASSIYPASANTLIESAKFNISIADVYSILASAIYKDGQQTTTQRIPFASGIQTDTVTEKTADTGVTLDSVLLKDGGATFVAAVAMTGLTSNLTVGGASIPQNSQSAAYTTVAADANKHILHPTADNNARTFTIDSNANVAYAIGTCITFVNQINTLTIAITSDTMTLAGAGTTGSRTLAASGIATALKIAATSWIIAGTGLT